MSRRFHLGILDKTKHEQIKDLTITDLKNQYGTREGVSISKLSNEVFTIGKDFDDSFLKEFSTRAFTSVAVHNSLNEEDCFYLINKDGFKALIDYFHKAVANHFKELLGDTTNPLNEETQNDRLSYIYFRQQEWGNTLNIKPYNLDEGDSITNSGNMEYLIFDLIRIYKTTNWDTQVVTISAW